MIVDFFGNEVAWQKTREEVKQAIVRKTSPTSGNTSMQASLFTMPISKPIDAAGRDQLPSV
jgi:hypothetical protein